MKKVNELKTLRKKNLNEESRDDSIENQSENNLSSRNNTTTEKQIKPIKRIEIDASEDNEYTSHLLKDVEHEATPTKNTKRVKY